MPADDQATPDAPKTPEAEGGYVPQGPDDVPAPAKPAAKEGELVDADGKTVTGGGADPADDGKEPLPEFEGWMGDVVDFLSESSLGRGLIRGGQWVWDHSTFVMILLVAAAVLTYTLRLRQRSDAEASNAAITGLYQLEQVVTQMEQLRIQANPLGGVSFGADEVADAMARGREALSNAAVATRDSDPPVTARSLRLQGDFHWLAATLPPPAFPSTRPAEERTEMPAAADSLASAKAAYQSVIDDYAQQRGEARVARFGLAAIAEEQGDFEAARAQYDAILAEDALPDVQKNYAEGRRALLDDLSTTGRLARGTATSATPPRGTDSLDDIGRDLSDLAGNAFDDLDLGALNDDDAAATTQPATQPAGAD